ncbi:MAG TPA: Ppx/GppA phosphatase family protein, partial [Candidatus Kapabacteria bacterium]
MRVASIDIGSNSIKLLVVETASSGKLLPLRQEKSMVRLGHETLLKGHLSSEAIVQAIRTLSVFKTLSQNLGAEQIIVVATASVREADNAQAFIREAEARTGLRIEVLSGIEEARLIGIAAAGGMNGKRSGPLLNIDIGGGSTELSLMRGAKAVTLQSMKIGAVRLSEQFLTTDPPKPNELLAMQREIEGALERPMRELKGKKWEIVTGTSGTILAIGAAFQSLNYPDNESMADGRSAGMIPSITMRADMLSEFNAHLAAIPVAERKKIKGISDQRAEIIVAGGQILETIMRAFKIKKVATCNSGLREGVLLDRRSEWDGHHQNRARELDARLAGAEALGERFGFEAAHGKHVSQLATMLFDQLKSLHGLKVHDRALLAAGALLHDIGYAIAPESHHKHSLYLILNSELTGFTDLERQIIANIARYHRRAFPKPSHAFFNALTMEDQSRVWMLGAITRLADAMDRS